ncbi:MAG: hypothetical protein KGI55_06360, partial [Gammaproteobacteria bacterium]|nr:hypothetical protein [Gammaproteobacteria bacterium]
MLLKDTEISRAESPGAVRIFSAFDARISPRCKAQESAFKILFSAAPRCLVKRRRDRTRLLRRNIRRSATMPRSPDAGAGRRNRVMFKVCIGVVLAILSLHGAGAVARGAQAG